MSIESSEAKTYLGRCRCCLNYGYIKYMWKKYETENGEEVYGNILTECFALSWENPESVEHDQICEPCVHRLKDAYEFRKLVIKSQLQLMQEIANDIRIEKQKFKVEETTDDEQLEKVEIIYEDHDVDMQVIGEENLNVEGDEKEYAVYENVEYLDEDAVIDNNKEDGEKQEQLSSESEEPIKKRSKRSKAPPPTDRNKRYMRYTAEDIQEAIEAVRNNRMSRLEASQYYKVPRKTLAIRVKEDSQMIKKDPTHQLMAKFIKEIKMLLTYTNATPYRSKLTHYACLYCNDGVFDDPADLRNHTRTVHFSVKTKRLDMVMRPYWLNEILKVDIQNLLCVVCCAPIFDWNSVLKHLKEEHQVPLDQAYSRIIPYCLESELKCVLCKESFDYYHHLDIHMNTHYDNYICVTCGESYLSLNRLKRHMNTHSSKKWPCHFCHKVFNTQSNVFKHESIVHRGSYHVCMYCEERFSSDSLRKAHVMEAHRDKLEIITCEICGKTFDWRPTYVEHMKRHSDKKWPCKYCEKVFNSHSNVLKHEHIVHKTSLYYKCMYCEERFSSYKLRKEHVTEVHSDKLREIKCELCEKVFNWKPYYIGHMKRSHGERNHKCPECDKCYVLKNDLMVHYAARHKGEKKYKCSYCDKLYSSRPGLTAHLKQHEEN